MGNIKNDKYISNYDLVEINIVKELYINKKIPVYSPIIQRRVDEEAVKIQNINYKSEYLEDLAKVHIFMKQFPVNKKYPMLNQMFEEQLFATYEYLKEQGQVSDFNKIFNEETFHSFEGVFYRKSDFLSTDQAITISNEHSKRISFNTKSKIIDVSIYNIILEKAGTHETQHFVTGDGTNIGLKENEKNKYKNFFFNEMCTEWNAIQITKKYLDNNIPENTIKKSIWFRKNITYTTQSDAYIELVQFYEPLNIISGNKLQNIYYNQKMNIYNLDDDKIIKGFQDITKLYTKLYPLIDTKNKHFRESKFDAMIKAFTDLSEYHIKTGIGLDENTNLETPEGKAKLEELKRFFDSFESITFKKSNEELYQRDIIKNNLLDLVFKDKDKIKTVSDYLDNKNEIAEVSKEETKESVKEVTKDKALSVSPNAIFFVPSFSEAKLKENIETMDIDCSFSDMKRFFDNHIMQYGFIKDDNGNYYKDNASDEEIKTIVRDFIQECPQFDDCVEFVTITKDGKSHVITDYTSEQELKKKAIKQELEDYKNSKNIKKDDSKDKNKGKDDIDLYK
ncbi:MAG: hypothetical protein E7273_14125 [Pseudobutyrivibrio ruminis]|nr:hypothetical protein [Pseudobutyrivibrio ruminis]